jgi:hypothetical protein
VPDTTEETASNPTLIAARPAPTPTAATPIVPTTDPNFSNVCEMLSIDPWMAAACLSNAPLNCSTAFVESANDFCSSEICPEIRTTRLAIGAIYSNRPALKSRSSFGPMAAIARTYGSASASAPGRTNGRAGTRTVPNSTNSQ